MNKQRYLLVLSGPSGCGKDTVTRRMKELYGNIEVSVSATTREMRDGEQEGIDYYYMSVAQFQDMIARNEILEHTCYCGNYYGTPRAEVEKRIDKSTTVVLVIEVEGGENIKKMYPECTTVFLKPASFEALENRLRSRGTDSEESIQKRLTRAKEELVYADRYDYTLVNDDLDTCARQLYRILSDRQADC